MFHGDFIGTDTAHPQCPLLDAGPLIRSLSARSFRSRHLPLPSDTLTIASSVADPPKVCKESGHVSQFGLPNDVKYVRAALPHPTARARKFSQTCVPALSRYCSTGTKPACERYVVTTVCG